jgi:NAD(P)H-nitrite reductase large subunit
MTLSFALKNNPGNENNSVAAGNFYQQVKKISSTIISLQYKPKEFLSFKVYEANLGAIVRQGVKDIALQCQIRGTTYTLVEEHLDQMSKRELNDLLNHLGLSGSL